MTWTITFVRWTAKLLGTAITECIDWEDIDLAEYVDPDEHFGDPIERLQRLEDAPGNVYVWEVETEEGAAQVTNLLHQHFERVGRDPDAAHFVLTDIEQLRQYNKDELRTFVAPFDRDGGEN